LIPYWIDTILNTLNSSTYVIVTDTSIGQLYLPDIVREFTKQIAEVQARDPATAAKVARGEPAGPRLLYYEVAPGEGAKSRKQKELIEDWMLENHCLRDTVLIALGGGVVGDLTGYVAAT
jgi:pentafunctional AROM polypeptide